MNVNPETGLARGRRRGRRSSDYFYQEFPPPRRRAGGIGSAGAAASAPPRKCATSFSEHAERDGRKTATSRNDERSRIAHLAARLMAEDGIEDYAAAKRKAARQAGVADTRQLPTNEEIDAALRMHQTLYGGDAHLERLRELRAQRARVMRDLERFNPYLTGSVLSGTAGKYADINLQLYTDDAKGVELFLIEQRHRLSRRAAPAVVSATKRGRSRRSPSTTTASRSSSWCSRCDDLRRPVRTHARRQAAWSARARRAVEALLGR